MAFGDHSGLEVVPQSERAEAQKYPYYSPESIPAHPNITTDTHKETYQTAVHEQNHARTICGIRRKTFWIVLAVAIVVVVGAVGGGVGGALASRSSNNTGNVPSTDPKRPSESHYSSADTIASSSATPSPTSSTASITTTTLVGPTSTILRDCPSSNNSIYSVTAGDTIMQFRKVCELSYLNINGIDNSVGGVTQTLNECINRCAAYNISNRTQIEQGENRICNSVCWRNTFDSRNDWAGGQCFGFTTQNTTSNGESVWRYRTPAETRCDSAALMNQEY
ncbi:hypothetical protein T440DRAFT_472093 [Plenodomus tracheiphilus IPT5]|uniref:Uncharacterized protein n=1 Tax=Plenodomus tracheiphilus IPT5 TaxID=1408161 RepID=A0A6A7ASS1_9PLEO|nr:hypothetical protein T440DRAFT_472093 [Plenodomus tracheiphilus IPT5]